jgi:hypothetical protein
MESWERAGGSLIPLTYTDATGHSAGVPNEDARHYVILLCTVGLWIPITVPNPPASPSQSPKRNHYLSGRPPRVPAEVVEHIGRNYLSQPEPGPLAEPQEVQQVLNVGRTVARAKFGPTK